MFKITPEFAKELKRGALLAVPQWAKVKGSGDSATKTWRETVKIEDFEVTSDEPGKEQVRVQFRVPSDVVSANQGRSFSDFLRFNWRDAQAGDKKAQQGCSINYRSLVALLDAAGYDGELESLDQIPKSIVGMLVSVNVKEQTDEEYGTQNRFGGYRTPKDE